MDISTLVLWAIGGLVVLFVSFRIWLTIQNNKAEKEKLTEQFEEKRKELLSIDQEEIETSHLKVQLDEFRVMYYKLFIVHVKQYVYRTHSETISNKKLSQLESDFREKYNDLMKAEVETTNAHFRIIKQELRKRGLMSPTNASIDTEL